MIKRHNIRAITVLGSLAAISASLLLSPQAQAATNWTIAANTLVTSSSAVAVNANFTAPSSVSGKYTLDVDIYNPAGQRVKRWSSVRTVTANQLISFNHSWTPTGQPAGTYIVKSGVWSGNFGRQLTYSATDAAVQLPLAPVGTRCISPAPSTPAAYQELFDTHNAYWSGGDSAYSVALPNGKTMWMFSDTFIGGLNADGSRASGSYMIHNSLLVQNGGCITPFTGAKDSTGNLTSLVASPNAATLGSWLWFQNAVVDGGSVRAIMREEIPNGTAFPDDGGDFVANFSTTGAFPKLTSVTNTPGSSQRDSHLPAWGAGMVQDSAYTYVYGTAAVDGAWAKQLYVARSPLGQLANPASWTFWNGTGWSTDKSTAAGLVDPNAGIEAAFSIDRLSNGTYRIIDKDFAFLGSTIAEWTAPSPNGPWTKQAAPLYNVPTPVTASGSNGVTYLGGTHLQAKLSSGQTLLTYNANSLTFSDVIADGHLYGPKFLSLPLAN